jgi:hypothetical protein
VCVSFRNGWCSVLSWNIFFSSLVFGCFLVDPVSLSQDRLGELGIEANDVELSEQPESELSPFFAGFFFLFFFLCFFVCPAHVCDMFEHRGWCGGKPAWSAPKRKI